MGSHTPTGESWFLCWFLHRYLDFRLPEAEACAEAEGCGGTLAWCVAVSPSHRRRSPSPWCTHSDCYNLAAWCHARRLPEGDSQDAAFRWLRAPSEAHAAGLARRSVLVKVILDVWGEGETLEECVAAVLACPDAKKAPYLRQDTTFKIVVDGYGVTYTQAQQVELIHGLDAIPFLGKVQLKAPEHTFWLVETHGQGEQGPLPACRKRFTFGRQVGCSDRSVLVALDLRQRRYLGTTSMDHEMAFIMCHMGLVKRGMLVHDPFVGTGSILMAAAHAGAFTSGGDIDVRVIRDGKRHKVTGQHVNVWTNFDDGGMQRPLQLLHCDLSALPMRRGLTGWAHAWVCDPPYGVRAGGRKSGGRKRDENGDVPAVPEHLRGNHVPSTAVYPLAECIADLLDEAAKALVMHGRLVYFYPAAAGDLVGECSMTETEGQESVSTAAQAAPHLPQHPCLELVAHSLQMLTSKWGRRLVTMRKCAEWTPEAKAAACVWSAQAAVDAVRARVMPQEGFPDEEDDGPTFNWAAYRGKRT